MALISIIVTNFNKAPFIESSLNSVICQSFQDWEMIVIDDHSTDNSFDILNSYLKEARIKIVRNDQNRGANYCRNHGIRLAKGKYIIFMDADDLLSPTCLENRLKISARYDNGQFWVFGMSVFHKDPGDDTRTWVPNSKDPLKDFLRHKLPWSILQPLWLREFLLQINGFDENFQRLQDVEMHTRALLTSGIKYYQFKDQFDCFYRIDTLRKNFSTAEFLQRWVKSALLYIEKYKGLAPQKSSKYLAGTFTATYLQLVYHLKIGELSAEDFNKLKFQLLSSSVYEKSGWLKKMTFSLFFFYNGLSISIPGINRIITWWLIHLPG